MRSTTPSGREIKAAPTTYGGQAVIEGVMIRGRKTIGLACRLPDGDIYRYRESLSSPLQRSRKTRGHRQDETILKITKIEA